MDQKDKMRTALGAVATTMDEIAKANALVVCLASKLKDDKVEAIRVLHGCGKTQALLGNLIFCIGNDPAEDEGQGEFLAITVFEGEVLGPIPTSEPSEPASTPEVCKEGHD